MSSNFGIYNIEASVQFASSASYQLAEDPASANFNERNLTQRDARDTTEYVSGLSASNNLQFTHVIPDISSSKHEVTSLNAFFSGTEVLEDSEVPAVANSYYSKQNRFVRKLYALTASSGMTVNPTIQRPPSNLEFGLGRATFQSISGSYRNNNYWNPAVFEIDVPDYGKIKDIKVWLELIHDHRGGPGTFSNSLPEIRRIPLQDFADTSEIKIGDTLYVLDWDYSAFPSFGGSYVLASVKVLFCSFSGGTEDSFIDIQVLSGDISTSYYGKQYYSKSSASFQGLEAFWEDTTVMTSEYSYSGSNTRQGLQGIQVALQSPNVYFENAHPLWNEETLKNKPKDLDTSIGQFSQVPKLLKNSYLLWAGHAVERDLGTTLGTATASLPDGYFVSASLTSSNDDSFNFTQNSSISLKCDKNNKVHAVTFKNDENKILYFRSLSASVSSQIKDFFEKKEIDSSLNGYNFSCDLFLSDELNPKIVASFEGPPGTYSVKYFKSENGGDSFSSEVIFSTSSLSSFSPSCKICEFNGTDYVFLQSSIETFCFRKVGASWIKEIISSGDSLYSQLFVLSTEKLKILNMKDLFESGITLHESSSLGWTNKRVSDVSHDPRFVSACLDNEENIHIFYNDNSPGGGGKLHYIVVDSSSKVSEKQIDFLRGDTASNIAINCCRNKNTGACEFLFFRSYSPISDYSLFIVNLENNLQSRRIVANDLTDYSLGSLDSAFDTDNFGNEHILYHFPEDFSNGKLKYFYKYNTLIPSFNALAGVYSLKVKAFDKKLSYYHSFNTDIDIRTIFSDSSKNSNPRHNLFVNNKPWQTFKLSDISKYYSPLISVSKDLFKFKDLHVYYDTDNFMTGSNFPWMLDTSSLPGNFVGRSYSIATASDGTYITNTTGSASVPDGWLTGLNKTAALNEWPTNGISLGPNDIKPVYPLLDDVYVEKVYDIPSLTSTASFPTDHKQLIGFRPGLRGTEVHGKWKLMIGNNADWNGSAMVGGVRDGFWFRQLRLEFLLDQGESESIKTIPSKNSRFRKSGSVTKPGFKLYEIVSGSAAWDIGTNYVYTVQPEEYGRSYGISSNEEDADFSVKCSITGAFYDILSASGKLSEVESSFLNNEFGTPYIPLSSGSAEIPSYNPFTTEEIKNNVRVFNEVLNPKTLVPRDNTLKAYLSRSGVIKTRRDNLLNLIASGTL